MTEEQIKQNKERLDAFEQAITKAFTDRGLLPPIIGDKAGQISVRFTNKPHSRQNDKSISEKMK